MPHFILIVLLVISCTSHRFYKAVKELAENKLSDGTGRKPLFRCGVLYFKIFISMSFVFLSMRTLCRSLQYVARNPCGSVYRSLYEVCVV